MSPFVEIFSKEFLATNFTVHKVLRLYYGVEIEFSSFLYAVEFDMTVRDKITFPKM